MYGKRSLLVISQFVRTLLRTATFIVLAMACGHRIGSCAIINDSKLEIDFAHVRPVSARSIPRIGASFSAARITSSPFTEDVRMDATDFRRSVDRHWIS